MSIMNKIMRKRYIELEKLRIEKKIERNNFVKAEIKKTMILIIFGLALLILMQVITSII